MLLTHKIRYPHFGITRWVSLLITAAMLLVTHQLAAASSTCTDTDCSTTIGHVLFQLGTTTVERSGRITPLNTDAELRSGDIILTGSNSGLQLSLTDGTRLKIFANTRIQILSYQYSTEAGASQADAHSYYYLFQGGFRTITGRISKLDRQQFVPPAQFQTTGIEGSGSPSSSHQAGLEGSGLPNENQQAGVEGSGSTQPDQQQAGIEGSGSNQASNRIDPVTQRAIDQVVAGIEGSGGTIDRYYTGTPVGGIEVHGTDYLATLCVIDSASTCSDACVQRAVDPYQSNALHEARFANEQVELYVGVNDGEIRIENRNGKLQLQEENYGCLGGSDEVPKALIRPPQSLLLQNAVPVLPNSSSNKDSAPVNDGSQPSEPDDQEPGDSEPSDSEQGDSEQRDSEQNDANNETQYDTSGGEESSSNNQSQSDAGADTEPSTEQPTDSNRTEETNQETTASTSANSNEPSNANQTHTGQSGSNSTTNQDTNQNAGQGNTTQDRATQGNTTQDSTTQGSNPNVNQETGPTDTTQPNNTSPAGISPNIENTTNEQTASNSASTSSNTNTGSSVDNNISPYAGNNSTSAGVGTADGNTTDANNDDVQQPIIGSANNNPINFTNSANSLSTNRAISISVSTTDITNNQTIFAQPEAVNAPNNELLNYSTGQNNSDIDGAVVTDTGGDISSGLYWGQWASNDTATSTVNNTTTTLNPSSLHWIIGPQQNAEEVSLPISGTASYALIGNTNPTDNNGNVGVLGNANLTADFTNLSVESDLNLSINGDVWSASGTGDIQSNGLFAGDYDDVNINGSPALQGNGTFDGFFILQPDASLPDNAGVTYQLNNDSTDATINGAAAFTID